MCVHRLRPAVCCLDLGSECLVIISMMLYKEKRTDLIQQDNNQRMTLKQDMI